MDKLFALFGKVVLVLVIVSAVSGASFYIGKLTSATLGKTSEVSLSPNPTLSLSPGPSPLVTPKTVKVVSAGLGNIAGVNFPKYTIAVPGDWTISQEHSEKDSPMDVLTVTKDTYRLKIFQAATGGSICLYPGDPAFEGPSASFTTFVELTDAQGRQYRRSGSEALAKNGAVGFTLCHKSSYGNWQQPTPFGHVSFNLPKNFDAALLKEMDTMVSSLKKL